MPDTTASQYLDWFSFTDLPKIQTLTPLKSQKTEGYETTLYYYQNSSLLFG